MGYETYRPKWTPEDAGTQFACRVMTGVEGEKDGGCLPEAEAVDLKRKLTLNDYEVGVLQSDRMILSRAITLIESNAPRHFGLAQDLIQRILPHTGRAIRIGITGVPGAGKSTFIETLGCMLCRCGKKVAVLTVDPSSSVSGGSILGDKTRMEQLSREPHAFIRPSPSSGTLGGVTRKSRETLLLCEAAGYDVILVETVGVGQGETTVRSMVDFFLVLVLTGAGDDLQGIKKGVIELADAIVVNKSDGENTQRANVTRADYNQILHYLRPATKGWITLAYTCSSVTGEGIENVWNIVLDFEKRMQGSGIFQDRRKQQTLKWIDSMVEEHLRNRIAQNPVISETGEKLKQQVIKGEISPAMAAQSLIEIMGKTLFLRQEIEHANK